MKLLAISLILFASSAYAYTRGEKEDYRISVLTELYSFIEHVGREISCYLKPLSDICKSYSSPILERLDFFNEIRAGGAMRAYEKLSERVSFTERENEVLEPFFSLLGRGYAEEELRLVERTVGGLADLISLERDRVKKEKKLTLTLCSAASLGLIILLI